MSKYLGDTKIVNASGFTFDVEFEYFPPTRGARNKYGVPMEPDEGAGLYILEAKLNGTDVLEILAAGVVDQIQEEIEEALIIDAQDAA